MSTPFDQYADTYRGEVDQAISFGGQGVDFYTKVKADHLLGVGRRWLGDPTRLRVLDVGCGVGQAGRCLSGKVGEFHGVDVSAPEVERARTNDPTGKYAVYDGTTLPYPDAHFDVAFAACVMHHVKPADWPSFVAGMKRVVRPGGAVIIYEHNPFNPLTRLAVSRCAFDKDAVLLSRRKVCRLFRDAGLTVAGAEYILFFPMAGRVFRGIERGLGWLPLGAQHAVVGWNGSVAAPAVGGVAA